jgi:tetratricopeptide (TPR) repeat protein
MARGLWAAAVTLLWLALPARALAGTLEDPDQDIARAHYQKGQAAYSAGDFRAALAEFEKARVALPLPELDFNVARCHDRLEHWAEAAAAYQRYLDKRPNAPDAADVRQRMEQVRARAAAATPSRPLPPSTSGSTSLSAAPPADRSAHPSRVAPIVVGVAAVALAAAGTGAYLAPWSDYGARRDQCAASGQCAPDSYADLRSRITTAEIAGGVLWGLAGAAAVIDVVLWAAYAKRARR